MRSVARPRGGVVVQHLERDGLGEAGLGDQVGLVDRAEAATAQHLTDVVDALDLGGRFAHTLPT